MFSALSTAVFIIIFCAYRDLMQYIEVGLTNLVLGYKEPCLPALHIHIYSIHV